MQIFAVLRSVFVLSLWGLLLWQGGAAATTDDLRSRPEQLRQVLLAPVSVREFAPRWEQLEAFYAAERFQPVWLGPNGPNRRAEKLRRHLEQAGREGLTAQHYHTARIVRLWASPDRSDRLRLELTLTRAFFDYARDVRRGRLDPAQVAPHWYIERVEVDVVNMLRLALLAADFGATLDALPPRHPGYRRLRKALAEYRAIEARGGWPTIPGGPVLKPGMSDSRVPLLRQRLSQEGELALSVAVKDEEYGMPLRYAVKRFQQRHGLTVDGVVGKNTLDALNVPVHQRIEQIILNMERWRWLPQYLGRRHIIVNIPAYELIAFEADEARLSMPVIIGTQERTTPVTHGRLYRVVFNPYWTVPRTIAVKDLLPRQRQNPDYLQSHRIRVFSNWKDGKELAPESIDWARLGINNFPYMLRQDPGPENALGRLKFLFNNRFNVYLHDTPQEALFANSVRTFSSGCVRLEEPLRLANFVLQGEREWDWSRATLKALTASEQHYEISLESQLPVYLLYLSAWVGEDGAVNFYRDVYGADGLLEPLLLVLMEPKG